MLKPLLESHYQAVLPVGVAALGVRLRDGVLVGLDFVPGDWPERWTDHLPDQPPDHPVVTQLRAELQAYLRDPAAPFTVPYRLEGSAFQRRVWAEMLTIEVGDTLTYGALASRLGTAARAVGGACGRNPLPIIVPCHRVVGRHGLGGFNQNREGLSSAIKQWLLHHERR